MSLRVRFVNPNTTASMTASVLAAARGAAPAGTTVDAATSRRGPPAIRGEADGRLALPGLLDEIDRANADGVDLAVIACFDDTGIAEARARGHACRCSGSASRRASRRSPSAGAIR